MTFDVHDCIAFMTNHGAKLLDESMNKRFSHQDITRTQWTALYYINRVENITQKKLAEEMMISEPSTTNLVTRLEASGLVKRTSHDENARFRYLELTDKGREKLNNLAYIPINFNLEATKDISQEDLDTFKRVMQKMIDSVEKDDPDQEES